MFFGDVVHLSTCHTTATATVYAGNRAWFCIIASPQLLLCASTRVHSGCVGPTAYVPEPSEGYVYYYVCAVDLWYLLLYHSSIKSSCWSRPLTQYMHAPRTPSRPKAGTNSNFHQSTNPSGKPGFLLVETCSRVGGATVIDDQR